MNPFWSEFSNCLARKLEPAQLPEVHIWHPINQEFFGHFYCFSSASSESLATLRKLIQSNTCHQDCSCGAELIEILEKQRRCFPSKTSEKS